jgi:hypothetical protein
MAGGRDLVAGELTVGGRARGFTMRLPPGAGGWIMRDWTTFDQQADAWGFAVAYPDGYEGCWARSAVATRGTSARTANCAGGRSPWWPVFLRRRGPHRYPPDGRRDPASETA